MVGLIAAAAAAAAAAVAPTPSVAAVVHPSAYVVSFLVPPEFDIRIFDSLFFQQLGDLPLLKLDTNNLGGNVTVKESVKGNKTNYECSLHGTCNRETGECECFDGW